MFHCDASCPRRQSHPRSCRRLMSRQCLIGLHLDSGQPNTPADMHESVPADGTCRTRQRTVSCQTNSAGGFARPRDKEAQMLLRNGKALGRSARTEPRERVFLAATQTLGASLPLSAQQ